MGPFDSLADKWTKLNMDEIESLIQFATHNVEIQSVFGVCFNSILSSGTIIIEPESSARSDSNTLVLPTAREESASRNRSAVFGEWARQGSFMEECIGWFPSSGVVADSGEVQPVVMNLSRMQVMHHMDVYGRHSWRWFEVLGLNGVHSQSMEYPGLRELFDIKVIGSSMPSSSGQINSRVKRIMNGEWSMYQSKKMLTLTADRERAMPTMVTQLQLSAYNPLSVSASADESFDQRVPNACGEENNIASQLVHALVSARNSNRPLFQPRKDDLVPQIELDPGRAYVNTHLANAPLDLNACRLAFLESCCLSWSVPLSLLTSSDSSGKAKLNSASASAETGKIFRDAQSERRKRLELYIATIYEFLFASSMAESYIRSCMMKRWSSKRKRKDEYVDLDSFSDDDVDVANVERHTRMRIQIPCNTQSSQLIERLELGVLKYSAFCRVDANQTGLSIESYNRKRIREESPK